VRIVAAVVIVVAGVAGAGGAGGIATLGCSDDSRFSGDAGLPDAGEDAGALDPAAPAPPAAPEPPAPPALGPCPEGWRSVPDADFPEIVTCDPWPASGRKACTGDEAQFPGRPDCERLGTACPAGDFADDLPAAGVLYVRAGAAGGGDGTGGNPFGTIADALAVAAEGGVIALSKGTFDEALTIDSSVTLWGACIAETTVASSDPSTVEATLAFEATGATVRNLRISGERIGVDVSGSSADPVRLENLVVEGASALGLQVRSRGSLDAQGVVVRGTRADGSAFGWGLQARSGAEVTLEGVVFEGNRAAAIVVGEAGTTLTATGLAVTGTLPRESDERFGMAIQAVSGAVVTLGESVLEENRSLEIVAAGPGTSVAVTRSTLRQTEAQESDRTGGFGVNVTDGASVSLNRTSVLGNRASGLLVELGAALDATDVVVADTRARERDGETGTGMQVYTGGVAVLERTAILRNLTAGIAAQDPATEVVATDLVVAGTLPQAADDDAGVGLSLLAGARGDLTRAALEGNRTIAILASGAGTSISLVDVAARGTQSLATTLDFGYGLQLDDGAVAAIERLVVERSRGAAVLFTGAGTTLTGSDLRVFDTQSLEASGRQGTGIEAQLGASASLQRVAVEGSRGTGVLSWDADLDLQDLSVTGTLEQSCATEGCADQPGGRGIASSQGGRFTATRFVSSDNALCGVQLVTGEVDLSEGVVAGNPIGANVQPAGFDLGRIQDHVVFRDNVRDLDAAALPPPEPVPSR